MLANSQATGPAIYDGRDNSSKALRIGIYIIFLEAINEGSGNGFLNVIIPTSGTFMAVLAIAKVSYAE